MFTSFCLAFLIILLNNRNPQFLTLLFFYFSQNSKFYKIEFYYIYFKIMLSTQDTHIESKNIIAEEYLGGIKVEVEFK